MKDAEIYYNNNNLEEEKGGIEFTEQKADQENDENFIEFR